MSTIDWSQGADVERRADVVSGARVVKGTRVQADAIVGNAADGYSAEDIAGDIFEDVPVEHIRGIIAVARSYGGRAA